MQDYILQLREQSVSFFENIGLSPYWATWVQSIAALLFILILSWGVGRIATVIMRGLAPVIVGKTKNKWDDLLMENNVFKILSYYLFGAVFIWLDQIIVAESLQRFIKTITGTYFIVVTLILINALLNTAYQIYQSLQKTDKASIKIYIQLLKVIVFSFGVILIISIFADKKLVEILTGLGAMLTILLIVYKDTILGFVAGISLSTNNMLQVGDWISVPQHDADGTVIDIGLSAVRVQNWDKTITTIPPYKLTSESFTNWKGMEEAGGRRVKRHVIIDIGSIHFLSPEEIDKFKQFHLLKDYIEEKLQAIEKTNKGVKEYVNQRRLTNIGTLKKYMENYLQSTGYARPDMTFIVRQLQSNEKGVPIEIYFFCKETAWAKYEQVQADVFDHFFAIMPEFGLRVFQNVSADALMKAIEKTTLSSSKS